MLKGYSSSHDQVVLDIRQRCRLRMVKVDESSVNIEAEYPALADHEEIA